MNGLLKALEVQRWDDHRYYHHSRVNQSLHLVSAASFLCSYVLLVTDPVAAAFVGWLVAMVSRQIGHFFFEPKGYDEVNHATHEHKEDIKVGYNLKRKVILLSIWAASPVVLCFDPTLFGIFDRAAFVHNTAAIWIALGAAALIFRGIQLFFLKDIETGVVWVIKILTDPFHDIKLYYKAPVYLIRGELIDPMEPEQRA